MANDSVLDFDSISVSSVQDSTLGKEAHKRFLNPKKYLLLLKDMDLRGITKELRLSDLHSTWETK